MSPNQQEQSEAKLLGYVEGDLGPIDRSEIERHLEAHPQHRKLLDEMKVSRDLLRWLPRESAPPDLAEAFQSQLERSVLLDSETGSAESGAMRIGFWTQYRGVAAVLALATGLGVAVYFVLPPRHGSLVLGTQPGPAVSPIESPTTTPLADVPSTQSIMPDLAPSPGGPRAPFALASPISPAEPMGAVAGIGAAGSRDADATTRPTAALTAAPPSAASPVASPAIGASATTDASPILPLPVAGATAAPEPVRVAMGMAARDAFNAWSNPASLDAPAADRKAMAKDESPDRPAALGATETTGRRMVLVVAAADLKAAGIQLDTMMSRAAGSSNESLPFAPASPAFAAARRDSAAGSKDALGADARAIDRTAKPFIGGVDAVARNVASAPQVMGGVTPSGIARAAAPLPAAAAAPATAAPAAAQPQPAIAAAPSPGPRMSPQAPARPAGSPPSPAPALVKRDNGPAAPIVSSAKPSDASAKSSGASAKPSDAPEDLQRSAGPARPPRVRLPRPPLRSHSPAKKRPPPRPLPTHRPWRRRARSKTRRIAA